MSVGAAIYGYRNNFGCKNGNKIPKKKKISIRLIDLLRDGYRTLSIYDDDLFVSIAQYLMKEGYPCPIQLSDNTDAIDEFFHEALFSINPFHAEYLRINMNGFNLYKWRKQFPLFKEKEITGLNFYRNRQSMPIPNFKSLKDIYKIIFTDRNFYNEENVRLKVSMKGWHHKADWILSKYMLVEKDTFTYVISHGCRDDFQNAKKGKSHSSWQWKIESEKDENYIDFCLRIYNNYDKIIAGDKSVLISEYEGRDFYLGGNFTLRRQISENEVPVLQLN